MNLGQGKITLGINHKQSGNELIGVKSKNFHLSMQSHKHQGKYLSWSHKNDYSLT